MDPMKYVFFAAMGLAAFVVATIVLRRRLFHRFGTVMGRTEYRHPERKHNPIVEIMEKLNAEESSSNEAEPPFVDPADET
jgi:hypothetical protein